MLKCGRSGSSHVTYEHPWNVKQAKIINKLLTYQIHYLAWHWRRHFVQQSAAPSYCNDYKADSGVRFSSLPVPVWSFPYLHVLCTLRRKGRADSGGGSVS